MMFGKDGMCSKGCVGVVSKEFGRMGKCRIWWVTVGTDGE